jgi:hypothetical protein
LTDSQAVLLSLTGAAGVEDDLTTGGVVVSLGLTGAAGEELLGGASLEDLTGEGEADGVTGQTVVETATTEVTTLVSVLLSSGHLVTLGWQEVMVLVWVL